MSSRETRLLDLFQGHQIYPYSSLQEDEQKWLSLLKEGAKSVTKYIVDRNQYFQTSLSIEKLNKTQREKKRQLLKELKSYESVSIHTGKIQVFLTWFQGVLNKIKEIQINPTETSSLVTRIKAKINEFLANLESQLKGQNSFEVQSVSEFLSSLEKEIKTEIRSIVQVFQAAFQTSKKFLNLQKAQHLAKSEELKEKLNSETLQLQEKIATEKKTFQTFLEELKTLLTKFPNAGSLHCQGNLLSASAGNGKTEDTLFSNLKYPEKRQTTFAKELRDVIVSVAPDLELPAAPTTNVQSRCPIIKPETSGGYIPNPHQAFIGQLFHPRLKMYKGFYAYHTVGSGKTLSGVEAILTWYKAAFPDEYPYVSRDVLILCPTRPLLSEWRTSIEKVFSQNKVKVVALHSPQNNTQVLEIGEKENKLFVIIQCFPLYPLDGKSYNLAQTRLWTAVPKENKKSFNQKNRSKGSIDAFQFSLEEKKQQEHFLYPSKGLVIIDEIHLAINPSDIFGRIDNQKRALTWTIGLKYMPGIKLLLESGTPMADDDRPLDVIKLLNLLKFPNEEVLDEGIWRAAVNEEQRNKPEWKEATTKLNETEKQKMAQYLQNEKIYSIYSGLVSYMTLEHDKTVYPQVVNTCPILKENLCEQKLITDEVPCHFVYHNDTKTFSCKAAEEQKQKLLFLKIDYAMEGKKKKKLPKKKRKTQISVHDGKLLPPLLISHPNIIIILFIRNHLNTEIFLNLSIKVLFIKNSIGTELWMF